MYPAKKYIIAILPLTVVFVAVAYLMTAGKELFLLPRDFPAATIQSYYNRNAPSFGTKLWLHRVNSYEKLKTAREYKGIEMDIHYNSAKDFFYIAHDSLSGGYIYLNQFLDSVNEVDQRYIWLDFKNLDRDNCIRSFDRLVSIIEKRHIRPENVIVESREPRCLSAYTSYGFNTSYYLPAFNPYDVSDEAIIQYAKKIGSQLHESNVTFISGNYKQYHFINAYFPNKPMLLWQTHRNLLASYLRDKLSDDPDVKVILIR